MGSEKIYFLYLPKPYLVNPNAQLGLGLLCIATYAKELGADIQILNAQGKPSSWKPQIPKNSTVCISACLVDYPILNGILTHLKDCYTVVGGPISKSKEAIQRASEIVDGLGEPWVEQFLLGTALNKTLEDYPIPDRSLLGDFTGGNIFHPNAGEQSNRSTTLLTSRGCIYECAFCSSGNCKDVYEYSLERVEKELQQIHSLGIKYLRVSDDNILLDQDRLFKLCDLLKRYGFTWRASIRTHPNDAYIYQYMKKSGCIELSFGIESADPDVLRIMTKGSTIDNNQAALENALSAGINNSRILLMMGTPGETRKTLELNKRFVECFPKSSVSMCAFYPFPGTKIYENPEKYGCRIDNESNPNICLHRADGTIAESHISIIDGLSREELNEQLNAMKTFLEERGQLNHG